MAKAPAWTQQTYFERVEAEASHRQLKGLRRLLELAKKAGPRVDLMWGAGEKHPRFAIRAWRKNAGELISGWADGTVGIQVANLRELLGPESSEVEYLLITMGREAALTEFEPLVDARLLNNRLVRKRMAALIERIAGLADDGAAPG